MMKKLLLKKRVKLKLPTLYKRTATGKIQVWTAEVDAENARYRTIWGQQDGKKTTGGWVYTEPTNVGRANHRDAGEQALFEANALQTKKLSEEFSLTIDDVDGHAVVKPMLAHKFDPEKPPKFPALISAKLDGIRCICDRNGKLWSRKGKEIISAPHLGEQGKKILELLREDITHLDGEIFYHDPDSDNFNKIISLARKTKPTQKDLAESKNLLEYHVYDCIGPGSYIKRTDSLRSSISVIAEQVQSVRWVRYVEVGSVEQVQLTCVNFVEAGYEGVMVRLNGPYEHKRSKNLLKCKQFDDSEFEVVDLEEGLGQWAGYAKKVTILLKDGSLCGAGIKGNQEYLAGVLKNKQDYIGGQATVRYFGYTTDGSLRFPVVVDLHGPERNY